MVPRLGPVRTSSRVSAVCGFSFCGCWTVKKDLGLPFSRMLSQETCGAVISSKCTAGSRESPFLAVFLCSQVTVPFNFFLLEPKGFIAPGPKGGSNTLHNICTDAASCPIYCLLWPLTTRTHGRVTISEQGGCLKENPCSTESRFSA